MSAPKPIEIAVGHAEAEGDAVVAAVHAYWRGLIGGGVPPRKTFDFMAVYQHAPHLLMSERVDRETFKFVYCGTAVAENFPLDLTGKSYGPETPRVSKVPWPTLFNSVLDIPCVRFGKWPIDWAGPRYAAVLFSACPLSGDDGAPRFALATLRFVGRRD